MMVNGQPDTDSLHGTLITSAQWNNSGWWSGTVGFDYTNVWEAGPSGLPILQGFAAGVQNPQVQSVSPGSGTAADPFKVYNNETLRKVGTGTDGWSLAAHYLQIANIDLDGTGNWVRVGVSQIAAFTGTYDGGGHAISNLTVNNTAEFQGLFGYISTGATVKNLGLLDVNVSGGPRAGGIVGFSEGTVSNCFVTGTITGGNDTGGIVACLTGTVENCYSATNVTGGNNTGGIVGYHAGTIRNSYATGNISGNSNTGGIAGISGTVQNSVALNKSVTSTAAAVGRVANATTMSGNYARSDMTDPGAAKFGASRGAADKNGADITSGNWTSETWWSGTVGFNFTNIWQMGTNGLPVLRAFIPWTAQNHTVQ
jgi:hypothetical protein